MKYNISFLPELEEDLFTGYGWYENKAPGLGEEFLRMFYACASEISWNPFLYTKAHIDFRRCLMRRFPYSIYFIIEESNIIVLGLFHCARNPCVVETRLGDRYQP